MSRKYNKKRVFLVVSILVIILILLFTSVGKIFNIIKDDVDLDSNIEKVNQDIEKTVEKKSITISFAGDVTMGNYKGSPYYGTFDNEFQNRGGDFDYFFENVKDVFLNDDLSVVNLEGPLTTAQNAKVKKFAFKGDPSYVNILKSGNIEAVTLANNHSEDYFEEGMKDTKFILDENDIKYFGLGEKAIVETNGIKVGLLGYNGWSENYNKENLENMRSDIESLKKEADMVAVYFHWGVEKSYSPNQTQKDFAHDAIDYGSDLVVGSHPHVLQGIEEYKGSMIYQQTFNFENNKLVSIDIPNVIPCSISSTKSRNDYKPIILQGSEGERILNKIKGISEDLNK